MEKQKIINEMQNMFKSMKGNDEEKDRYFFFSPKYNPKVKITDWFLPLEAVSKDNDPYGHPGGSYFESTYRRLGTDEGTELETTTQAMLRQICNPPPAPSPYRPLVNAASYDIVRHRDGDLIESKNSSSCNETNFMTTYKCDYKHPFPYRRNIPCKTKEKTVKRFGLVSQFNKFKICETKFLDDALYSLNLKKETTVR